MGWVCRIVGLIGSYLGLEGAYRNWVLIYFYYKNKYAYRMRLRVIYANIRINVSGE